MTTTFIDFVMCLTIATGTAMPDTDTVIAKGQSWEYTDLPVAGACSVIFYDNGTPDNITDDIIIAVRNRNYEN